MNPPAEREALQPEVFESQDVGQVEDFVSKIYSKMTIGAVGDRTRAKIARRVLSPEIGFDDLDYSFAIGYSAEPPDLLIVCDVVSNTISASNAGSETTFGPGDQFLISRPELPYAGVAHSSRLRFTLIDPAILDRVAAGAESPGAAGERVRLLDHRPVSAHAQLRLQRTIAYLRDDVLAATDSPPSSMIMSTASQYLAASVLQTYPNTAVDTPTVADRNDGNPSTARRAVAFIDTNADLDLTVADIARAAYVTPRALQLAFRRHLDTTPMTYLRDVRLTRARDDLRMARGDGSSTVTSIAARWGFTSSRFSRQYRETFGELPGQTLRAD